MYSRNQEIRFLFACRLRCFRILNTPIHALIGFLSACNRTDRFAVCFKVAVEFNPGMQLKGGSLSREYNAFYMAFHWGSQTSNGSEHLYNFRKYPMEVDTHTHTHAHSHTQKHTIILMLIIAVYG